MSKKLISIDIDESRRKVIGLSGFRRCLFLSDFFDQIVAEGRLSDKKNNGDRVAAAMHEDGLDSESQDYSSDTLGRYQLDNIPWFAILDRLGACRSLIVWVDADH